MSFLFLFLSFVFKKKKQKQNQCSQTYLPRFETSVTIYKATMSASLEQWHLKRTLEGYCHEERTSRRRFCVLMKGSLEKPPCSSCCEDRLRSWPSKNQEAGCKQMMNLPELCSWVSQPPEMWELHFCCL